MNRRELIDAAQQAAWREFNDPAKARAVAIERGRAMAQVADQKEAHRVELNLARFRRLKAWFKQREEQRRLRVATVDKYTAARTAFPRPKAIDYDVEVRRPVEVPLRLPCIGCGGTTPIGREYCGLCTTGYDLDGMDQALNQALDALADFEDMSANERYILLHPKRYHKLREVKAGGPSSRPV